MASAQSSALAAAGADARAPEQEILERHRQLLLHGVVAACATMSALVRAQAHGAAGHLAGQLDTRG